MEHGRPFARLAADVAAARARGRPTRLVLRHTERFGLVHLYFQDGRLARVEGHLGTPTATLQDLATWDQGVIRRDDDPGAFVDDADPQIEAVFAEALRLLEARGVVQPAPPARIWPSRSRPRVDPRSASAVGGQQAPFATASRPSASIGSGDLPPLSTVDEIERSVPPVPPSERTAASPPAPSSAPPATSPGTGAATQTTLTEPQWQLLALVIHQVVEKAGGLVGPQMAESILAQALQHAARSYPLLGSLEIDALGWLRAREGERMTAYPAFDVADAVAALLTSFEMRCASLIGADNAQKMMASAAGPFKAALRQIGLDVAD